jgi:putative addiction module component (TIGR02574 family)
MGPVVVRGARGHPQNLRRLLKVQTDEVTELHQFSLQVCSKVGELVGRLTEDLHASDPETQAAWKTEVDRRVQEIQSGKLQGIPGEEVFARVRKIIGR